MQWSPRIITDLIRQDELSGCTIVLHDLDQAAASLALQYGRRAVAQLGVDATLRVEPDLARAIEGAGYVIITISTGGLQAMRLDLSIPEEFGVFHTVGDSCGPGGWSRFIRNFPVFRSLAQAIRTYAPDAVVLNYTNPMTTLTGVLTRELDNPVIGLCHGLFDNLELLERAYGVVESQIAVRYGGLNHFFWMTRARIGALDVVADLAQRVVGGQSLTALDESLPGASPVGAFHSSHEIATELFELTGVLPFFEDRHTAEFLPWTITDLDQMSKQRLVRTTIADREANQRSWTAEVEEAVRGGIPVAHLEPSREGAAEVIAAHHGNGVYIDVGNVPNRGQVRELPQGLVVETAVRTDRNGFTPLLADPLPPAAASLLAAPAAAYQMVVDACFESDRSAAVRALRLEPSTAHLSTARVNDLAARLLEANEPYGICL